MTETAKRPLYVPHAGPSLLEMPLLNKGSAFSTQERIDFNLQGLLPHNIETIEEQTERAYSQYNLCNTDLDRHIFLRSIQDNNETLFFRLLEEHLEEMMPIIYTPTVGQACQEFSKIYRTHRGLFISYPDRERIDDILRSATKNNVKIVVVTDSERILGLGDQGIGGWASRSASCRCTPPAAVSARLHPAGGAGRGHQQPGPAQRPDVHGLAPRAGERGAVRGVRRPVHPGDQAPLAQRPAAIRGLRPDQCHAVAGALQGRAVLLQRRHPGHRRGGRGHLLAACKAKGEKLSEQTVTFVGAGSAGCGIAEQIIAAMQLEGLDEAQARRRIFMVDRWGLLTDDMSNLLDFQHRLAQKRADLGAWGGQQGDDLALLEVIRNARPTVLIGVSGQRGLFSEEVIRELHSHCKQPLVMPLSNPTSRVEATPQEILNWTDGQALVATGSPFQPVQVGDKRIPIAQCNNAYIFPGIGLGVIAARANRVTEGMLMAAANALANCSPIVTRARAPCCRRWVTSARSASASPSPWPSRPRPRARPLHTSDEVLNDAIEANFWFPRYRAYRRTSF